MKKNTIRLLHIIFWFVTFVSTGLQTIPSFGITPINLIIWDYLLYVFSFFTIFYVFYFTISKKYLNKERIKYLIILGFLFTIIFSVFSTFVYYLILSPEIFSLGGNEFVLKFSKTFYQNLDTNFTFALFGSLIKIALLWFDNLVKQKEVEKQKIKSELALLKTQINPKLLINTLEEFKNFIEESPEEAILIVENLSDIMSYMLYDTKKELVPIENEIKHIHNYLFLQKIKLKQITINFDVSEEITGKSVPPLLLLTYIDSIFNSEVDFSGVKVININLKIFDTKLDFDIVFIYGKSDDRISIYESILEKISGKRLSILYKEKYSFSSENKRDECCFKLKFEC